MLFTVRRGNVSESPLGIPLEFLEKCSNVVQLLQLYIASLSLHAIILTIHQFVLCVDKEFAGKKPRLYRGEIFRSSRFNLFRCRMQCHESANIHHFVDLPSV